MTVRETDRKELQRIENQLLELDERIERLQAQLMRRDPVAEHFAGGRVGGSGNPQRIARLNEQRARALDKHIDQSVELTRLIKERKHLQARINALVKRPLWERVLDEYARRKQEAVRAAGVGCKVETALFGVVTVVRINRKSVTVETVSGYKQTVPYGDIGRVVGWT